MSAGAERHGPSSSQVASAKTSTGNAHNQRDTRTIAMPEATH
ncbi:hypothetical protein [Roseateles terrae]|uniref:Uncharacterized protein n=1 Tax=Roseateles terrae TaxID=431060 RepID=A0ABR6GSG6_9BURK|nr:hypothetical protein [Roseateles terrae]MBB3195068.1 hypothetical protein [Roseateles terrae]